MLTGTVNCLSINYLLTLALFLSQIGPRFRPCAHVLLFELNRSAGAKYGVRVGAFSTHTEVAPAQGVCEEDLRLIIPILLLKSAVCEIGRNSKEKQSWHDTFGSHGIIKFTKVRSYLGFCTQCARRWTPNIKTVRGFISGGFTAGPCDPASPVLL